jgi:hypothetical protein
MRYLRSLAFFLLAVVCVFNGADLPQFKNVKTIYVAPIEGSSLCDMVHGKLISAVSKIPGVTVVEDESKADAILIASGLRATPINIEYGNVLYNLQGGVRLLSNKQGGMVLWADNVSNSRLARSVSSSFAENVAKSLERVFADRR